MFRTLKELEVLIIMDKKSLMDLIDTTANEDEVKSDTGLSSALLVAYRDLNDDKEIRNVVRKLGSTLSAYLMTHQYKASPSVMNLAKVVQKDDQNFWKGTGLSKLFW